MEAKIIHINIPKIGGKTASMPTSFFIPDTSSNISRKTKLTQSTSMDQVDVRTPPIPSKLLTLIASTTLTTKGGWTRINPTTSSPPSSANLFWRPAIQRRVSNDRRSCWWPPPSSHRCWWVFLLLMTWAIVCHDNFQLTEAAHSLSGDIQSCSNEGEEIQIGIRNSKCFKCACQDGFVKCDQEMCPPLDYCYLLEKRTSDTCCSRCKGCVYRGVTYVSGSEWLDAEDPCRSFKCIGSVITETRMKCYTQCDGSQLIPPKPGECCPTCRNCKINGQLVREGEEVVASIDDRCLICQCTKGQLKCAKKTCPVLQCPISKQKSHPNECCPRCTEQREVMALPGKCIFGNKMYMDKVQFMPDRCTNCTCSNGTTICERQTCPILECSQMYQEMDGCCPRCVSAEVGTECMYNDIVYPNNKTWSLDACRSCCCTAGNIRCSETKCQEVKCRSNEELVRPQGECCPKCIEAAGSCTVFGDPHFKTFDGKFFSFQGSCKYLLAADCLDHSFSIRLTNDARTTNRSSWTKTITLKMGTIRVNLGQKMRIKVNGTRVTLPYSQGPILSLERLNSTVLLRTELGLNLEWDGNNFLQVVVPSSFKRKLCGLCGNYNGMVRDDLTSRDGTIHSNNEVWRFANSWKVGGIRACSRHNELLAIQPTCKQRKSYAFCKPLKESAVFGHCDSSLNPSNFYESCKMDVCECLSGMCHCDSFAAYAHECQRRGVKVPDWREATNCPMGVFRRNLTTTVALLRGNRNYGDLEFLLHQVAKSNLMSSNVNTLPSSSSSPKPHRRRKQFHHYRYHQQPQPQQRRQQHQIHADLVKRLRLQDQRELERLSPQLFQHDFISKHVPKSLLMAKHPNRTPPPLH